MEITLIMKYYPGFGDKPRPACRVTARALRRGPGGQLDEFIHTRLVDAPYPESWIDGLRQGLKAMASLEFAQELLRQRKDGTTLEEQTARLLGVA